MRHACALPGLVALVAAVVAGCATVPMPAQRGRVPDAERLTQWVARGRIALAAGDEGGSGSFTWQQNSGRTHLAVRGPLGAGRFEVVTDGPSLQVDDGSGRPVDGEAARRAIEQRLGALLPLEHFRYWMLGVPAPEDRLGPAEAVAGPATGFTQQGWLVTYEAFRSAGPWSLPARLTASSGAARVRVVVDDWQVPASP